jgi:hypothetical protein
MITMFSRKIRYEYCLSFTKLLEVNPRAHSHKIRMTTFADYFESFGKGCRIIRRAEFLEQVWYCIILQPS